MEVKYLSNVDLVNLAEEVNSYTQGEWELHKSLGISFLGNIILYVQAIKRWTPSSLGSDRPKAPPPGKV